MAKKGAFKSKGTDILQKPSSMDEFLKGGSKKDEQLRISTNTQKHINTDPQETERFHLQIRKDLADKLYDEILKRKRSRNGKKATQRAIIEEALESYLLTN